MSFDAWYSENNSSGHCYQAVENTEKRGSEASTTTRHKTTKTIRHKTEKTYEIKQEKTI